MAKLNKVSVPTAAEHLTKLDLSFDHVTTAAFMACCPVGYRHMIAGERLSLNIESAVRPAPIEVPFFGSLVQNNRVFFVPYRLVFPQYDSFINDTIGVNASYASLVTKPPYFGADDLVNLFTSSVVSTAGTASDFDFKYSSNYYILTTIGRRFLKVLESLGYKLILSKTSIANFQYNALALLAYAQVHLDWYTNHNYLNTQDILDIRKLLTYNDPTTPLRLTAADLRKILTVCHDCYYDRDDYYTAAWDNPTGPVAGQFSAFTFTDPSSTGGAYVQLNSNGTPEMNSTSTYPHSIGTEYIHQALKKLTDYQKRHALVGALNIDRALAEHGFLSDYLKLTRSIYVGSQKLVIDTGSVMSTAAGNNGNSTNPVESTPGDYAGAGFGKGSKSFEFSCNEDGILLIISSVVPIGSLVQGYDRNNVLLEKQQFFNADFDALSVQSIQKGEVYVSDNSDFCNDAGDYTVTFGFTGRYGEKKRPKSFLTGDIRLPRLYAGGSSWHLFRLFKDSNFASTSYPNGNVLNVSHSQDFTSGSDASQYHRVFQYVYGDYQPFFCFFHFDMVAYSPCKQLFDTYDFDSNGKEIVFDNTAKAN